MTSFTGPPILTTGRRPRTRVAGSYSRIPVSSPSTALVLVTKFKTKWPLLHRIFARIWINSRKSRISSSPKTIIWTMAATGTTLRLSAGSLGLAALILWVGPMIIGRVKHLSNSSHLSAHMTYTPPAPVMRNYSMTCSIRHSEQELQYIVKSIKARRVTSTSAFPKAAWTSMLKASTLRARMLMTARPPRSITRSRSWHWTTKTYSRGSSNLFSGWYTRREIEMRW